MKENELHILIAGDTVPTASNERLFIDGDIETLFGKELIELFLESDFNILNLETPLSEVVEPIEKNGPCLNASPEAVNGLKKMNVGAVSLANNHIMDQGVKGLESTIAALNKYQISSFGYGSNIREASKPFVYEKHGKKVGIYSCAEHEFSIAGSNTPGANPFDPLYSLDEISELKEKCDFVIILYHGGKEEYVYPTPEEQRICRRMVEKGADVVLAQHSHCVGSFEYYKDGFILYGQGNLIFDSSETPCWDNGLLFSLTLKGESKDIDLIPVVRKENCIRIAKPTEKEKILNDLDDHSIRIADENYVSELFEKECNSVYDYLSIFGGRAVNNRIFRLFNKITNNGLMRKTYTKNQLLTILNLIKCETHRESIVSSLEKRLRIAKK